MQQAGNTAGSQQAAMGWREITVIVLATIALRAIWWGDPVVDFDEQLYSHIGWRMTQGEWPYIDNWDRKPFGLFAVFALSHGILGAGPEAFQALAALSALACAFLTYRIARDMTGKFTAVAATILVLILISVFGSRSGQAEIFFLPFMLGMIALLRNANGPRFEARVLLAMLLGGVALQIKYTVLPQCVGLGLYALWRLHLRGIGFLGLARRAALYAALGIAPTALVGLIYWSIGGWGAWWFANFESFFLRTPAGRFGAHVWLPGFSLIALLAGGWYAALRLIKPDNSETYLLVSLWALLCLGSVLLPGTVYFYYLAALAPAAVLVAIPLTDARGPLRWGHSIVLPLLAIVALTPHSRWTEARENKVKLENLATAISPLVNQSDECLYIHDGPTALYQASGSCTPSVYLYPDHLNNGLETGAIGIDQTAEVERILAGNPPVIVTASRSVTRQNPDVFDAVRNVIESDYELLHSEQLGKRKITAWKLRENGALDD